MNTPTIREIQIAVGAEFGVTLLDLLSDRRGRGISRPRQIAMWLARHLTPHSLPAIGRQFGRDHTTVIHAIAAVDARMLRDWQLARQVQALREAVESVDCVDSGVHADKRQMHLRLVA